MEAAGRNIAARSSKRRISINLDSKVIDYFKELSVLQEQLHANTYSFLSDILSLLLS